MAQHMDGVLHELLDEVRELKRGSFATTEEEVDHLMEQSRLRREAAERQGSRYIGPNGDTGLAARIASGESIKTATRSWGTKGYDGGTSLVAAEHKGGSSLLADLKALGSGTGSSGGYLTSIQLATELTPILRARTAVIAMGARVLPVEKELDVAALSSGATAYWLSEGAAIPTSEETFSMSAILRPKPLAALVPVSNRLLRINHVSPALDESLKGDLGEVIALRADLAFLRGTGTGGEPTGLRNTSGLTAAPSLGANGRAITYDDLMDVVAALRNVNAPFTSPGWCFNSRLLSSLAKLKTTTGSYLTDANLLTYDKTGGGGTLLGFPFRTTSQIPTNVTTGTSTDTTEIYFSSDWSEYWIGQTDGIEITLSPDASYTPDGGTTWVSAFQNAQTLFRAMLWLDGAPRRPQLFTVLTGVRP